MTMFSKNNALQAGLAAAIALAGGPSKSRKGQWNTGPKHTPAKKAKKRVRRKIAKASRRRNRQ